MNRSRLRRESRSTLYAKELPRDGHRRTRAAAVTRRRRYPTNTQDSIPPPGPAADGGCIRPDRATFELANTTNTTPNRKRQLPVSQRYPSLYST
jgi:hypothetical protein